MKSLFFVCVLSSMSFTLMASSEEIIPFTKKFFVESCNKKGKCQEFQLNNEPAQMTEMKLTKFKKGNVEGLHGEEKFQTVVDGIPFKSEIFVNKIKEEYSLTLIVRSGEGAKRAGVTKKVTFKDFAVFKPLTVSDKSIEKNGNVYRAKVVLSSDE